MGDSKVQKEAYMNAEAKACTGDYHDSLAMTSSTYTTCMISSVSFLSYGTLEKQAHNEYINVEACMYSVHKYM